MKKILFLFCFLLANFSVYAQKSYVYMVSYHNTMDGDNPTKPTIYLSGNVPISIEQYYGKGKQAFGDVLNMLANEGFVVEQQNMSSKSNGGFYQTCLLSKSSSTTYNAVRSVQIENEEIIEIARYNLQGLPVNENEKGIQIIVYSNYTTKTIIVQ